MITAFLAEAAHLVPSGDRTTSETVLGIWGVPAIGFKVFGFGEVVVRASPAPSGVSDQREGGGSGGCCGGEHASATAAPAASYGLGAFMPCCGLRYGMMGMVFG